MIERDRRQFEEVLLDYIERYGLTERARRLFLPETASENQDACPQPERPGDDSDASH